MEIVWRGVIDCIQWQFRCVVPENPVMLSPGRLSIGNATVRLYLFTG
jgi:hypothetical protein